MQKLLFTIMALVITAGPSIAGDSVYVSGTIKDNVAMGPVQAVVKLSIGNDSWLDTTDAQGRYTFAVTNKYNIPGLGLQVTPEECYVDTMVGLTISNPNDGIPDRFTQDFVLRKSSLCDSVNISGLVTDVNGIGIQGAIVSTHSTGKRVADTTDAAGRYTLATIIKYGEKTAFVLANCAGYQPAGGSTSIERSPGMTGPVIMVTYNIVMKKSAAAAMPEAYAPQRAQPAGPVSLYTISGKKIGTRQAGAAAAFEHGRARGADAPSKIVIQRYESSGRSVCRVIGNR